MKKIGPGKQDRMFYKIPKGSIKVKVGNIVYIEGDGLYIVDKISLGCASVKFATVYCSPFDPKEVGHTKVMVPKYHKKL